MNVARNDQIIAIKTASGSVVGFHAHNLEVAKLDDVAWSALSNSSSLEALEALEEIKLWNAQVNESATDSVLAQGVRSLAINIAQICNLKCGYCAAGGDGTFGDPMKEADLATLHEQIRTLLHDVPNGGEFKITFLGGEPLIVPDAIRSIHRFAKRQTAGRDIRLRYEIVTNGTLVSPLVAELLASMQAHVTVSIDGPPEINDVNRPTKGGQGSTAKTLKGIEQLLRVKDRLGSLSCGAVFGKHHTGVMATYEFLQPMGFDSLRFDFAVGDKDERASAEYVSELRKVADLAWALGGENELRRLSMFDLYFRTLDAQKRIHNHCGAGKTHLHSDSRGRLTTCQWFSGVKEEQVGEGSVIDLEKLKAFADPLIERHGCGTCWARHLCGGGCMFVNKTKKGSKHEKDEEFCIRTRSIIAKGIEYYAEARYED